MDQEQVEGAMVSTQKSVPRIEPLSTLRSIIASEVKEQNTDSRIKVS